MPSINILHSGQLLNSVPIALGDEIKVGRDEHCQIRINDQVVSREHAIIWVNDGQLQVERKSSFGNILVQGNDITKAIVKPNEFVDIGPYRLVYVEQGSLGAAASSSDHPSASASMPVSDLEKPSQDLDAFSLDEASDLGNHLDDNLMPASENPPSQIKAEDVSTQFEFNAENKENLVANDFELPLNPELLKTQDQNQKDAKQSSSSEKLEGLTFNLNLSEEVIKPLEGIETLGPHELKSSPESVQPISLSSAESLSNEDPTDKVLQPDLKFVLHFEPGSANCTEYVITKSQIIAGRAEQCDVLLLDPKASRKHFSITTKGSKVTIEDLKSENGTFVNGKRIEKTTLADQDIIRVGNSETIFKASNESLKNNLQAVANVSSDFLQSPPRTELGGSAVSPKEQLEADLNFTLTGFKLEDSKKKTLLERYRKLKPWQQIVVGIAFAGLLYVLLGDDDQKPVPKPSASPQASSSPLANQGSPAKDALQLKTIDQLTPEQQKFVKTEHDLALEFFKNQDYDKALFEIGKVFTLVDDYLDSRDIERYSKEAKKKLEAKLDEQKRQKDKEGLAAQIAALLADANQKKQNAAYPAALDSLSQIFMLDPDNAAATALRKEIEGIQEKEAEEKQKAQLQKDLNARAEDLYSQAVNQLKKHKFQASFDLSLQVLSSGSNDQNLMAKAKNLQVQIKKTIARLVQPHLRKASQLEQDQKLALAYKEYAAARSIDSKNVLARNGMNRIRGRLIHIAKQLYTEAILSESYSDFENAKTKFKECLNVAPRDSHYYNSAKHKLSHYFEFQSASDSGKS